MGSQASSLRERPLTSLQISMAAGNGAKRSDRIERGIIRSLHYVTFPAAIQKSEFVSGLACVRVAGWGPPSRRQDACDPRGGRDARAPHPPYFVF